MGLAFPAATQKPSVSCLATATPAGPRRCRGVCGCRLGGPQSHRGGGFKGQRPGLSRAGTLGHRASSEMVSSPRHPAGSAHPAHREDGGRATPPLQQPCTPGRAWLLQGVHGPVAGSQPWAPRLAGSQPPCYIDPPVGHIVWTRPHCSVVLKAANRGKFCEPLCVASSSCQVWGATFPSHPGAAGWPLRSPPNGGKGLPRSQVATWGEAQPSRL